MSRQRSLNFRNTSLSQTYLKLFVDVAIISYTIISIISNMQCYIILVCILCIYRIYCFEYDLYVKTRIWLSIDVCYIIIPMLLWTEFRIYLFNYIIYLYTFCTIHIWSYDLGKNSDIFNIIFYNNYNNQL